MTDYNELAREARQISASLPDEARDAFYQLVLYPVEACANLNELYVTVGRNRLYARQGRTTTNGLAEKARQLFARDAELARDYNQTMAGGKWNHMMDQTHIGYTHWQQPPKDVMPEVRELQVLVAPGQEPCRPPGIQPLPEFDPLHRAFRPRTDALRVQSRTGRLLARRNAGPGAARR